MAAIRQHILPRFLLKGFASRIQGKEIYTWVYKQEQEPFETNIINIGVEKYFYGGDGELSVDDEITDFEGNYAPLIDELRSYKGTKEISHHRIPNLIAHLMIRTKHIRESFRESTEFLTDKILEYFSDFNNIKAAMLSKPEMIRDYMEKGFKDHPILKPYENLIWPLLPKLFIRLLDNNKDEMEKLSKLYFETIKKIAPKALKEGHIKGLSQSLTPELRVEDYKRLQWFLYNTCELIILGDTGCLFEIKDKIRFKSINMDRDKIINIFLPISERQIIIGTSHPTIPDIEINVINENIAKCSREFFICSKKYQHLTSLHSLIGNDPGIISKEDVEQIAKNLFYEYRVNYN